MPLASYAMKDEDSEGRRYPEPRHPYRTDFQRDRDRVIHTKAFRRLENKTQVFTPDYSDHFRNRLTHTIEVSQISRTIAKALELNSDLAEVLALSHDIGHPPFSHEGEKALDRIMKEFGSGFDHNLHALRIVEDFEEKYAAFRGLNLTFEVREGIIKHSRDYPADATASVDIGPYRLGQRPPLEAQLIDLADEIAYNSADLDDGYDSGLLTVLQMESELRLFRRLWREVTERFPGAGERVRISEVIRRVIDTLVTDLIEETRHRLNEGRIASVEDVRRAEHRLVGFSQETGALNLELKQFLRDRLYDHRVLKRAREDAQRQLEDLFRYYLSQPETLPLSHRERIDELGMARVVCDYVAGMTDMYARAKHRRVFANL
ncbi:MAG: deoxyguanosinetriphosphate triphosphohydrolase [Acidobacteriota bacterium]|jgi:dGTPase